MAGASKTLKKITNPSKLQKDLLPNPFSVNAMFDSHANPLNVGKDSASDVTDLFTPDISEPEEQTIIPIPSDRESELKARKKRARTKTSGRSSTILTEGLGG